MLLNDPIHAGATRARAPQSSTLVGAALVALGVALGACNAGPEGEDPSSEAARTARAPTTLAQGLMNPVGLVAGGGRVFWITQPALEDVFRSDAIMTVTRTADPSREPPTRIVNPDGVDGIAITGLTADATRVYYTSRAAGGSTLPTVVTSIAPDGSNARVLHTEATENLGNAVLFESDPEGALYFVRAARFAGWSAVWRVPRDGSAAAREVFLNDQPILDIEVWEGGFVWMQDNRLYVRGLEPTAQSAPFRGAQADQDWVGALSVMPVSDSLAQVFWLGATLDARSLRMASVHAEQSAVLAQFATADQVYTDVCARDGVLYATDRASSQVVAFTSATASVRVIAAGQTNPRSLAVDDRYVYWIADGPGGAADSVVRRVAKVSVP